MRRTATFLLILGLALGICASVQARMIEPNIGFCTPPASATACSGQPETNQISSSAAIGMWVFGSNSTSGPWYLILAIPDGTYTNSTAPALTSSSFNSDRATSPSFLTTGSSNPGNFNSSNCSNDIYSYLGGHVGESPHSSGPHRPHHRGPANNSMNATNMFGPLEQAAFGGIPNYFQLLVYTFTAGSLNGNTAYSFTSSTALPAGTLIAAIAESCGKQLITSFTTAAMVCAPIPEPASLVMMSSGLLLLAGVLRRHFRG